MYNPINRQQQPTVNNPINRQQSTKGQTNKEQHTTVNTEQQLFNPINQQ
jgi:hypothetical protein